MNEAAARDAVWIDGLPLDRLDPAGVVAHVRQALAAGRGGIIVTPNLQFVHLARRDPSFRALVCAAGLSVADGVPLLWASRIAGDPLPARVNGTDLIGRMSSALAADGRSLYLLGGRTGAADTAARRLTTEHPGLRIAGWACPAPGFDTDPAMLAAVLDDLRRAAPDFVLVGLGAPRQERFMTAAAAVMPATWWIGIGGSLDFLAGHVRRAPEWMRSAGLEWLHRLGCEPRRLARRYLLEGVPTAGRVLLAACLRRYRGAKKSRRS